MKFTTETQRHREDRKSVSEIILNPLVDEMQKVFA